MSQEIKRERPAWRIGIVGLGRAATAMLPSMLSHPDVEIVALCEPRADLRNAFIDDFAVQGYEDIEDLCADPNVDVVYVASPHQFHRDHAIQAVTAGKHVLVEKPMALNLDECDDMINAANTACVVMMVGHTNGYDAPILALREFVQTGRFGRIRMINTMNYSDFLYRPRRPEELDSALGGGIMYNQFPHQVEIVRTIANSQALSVSAVCGVWDSDRPTEGAVSALIRFEHDLVANIVYSGYAHLNALQVFRGLDNVDLDASDFAGRRAALVDIVREDEVKLRVQAGYPDRRNAIIAGAKKAIEHERFGVLITSFDHADVVQSPTGLVAYADEGPQRIDVPFGRGGGLRATVIDELCDALDGKPVIHDGRWARVTLSICLAAIESSESGREIELA